MLARPFRPAATSATTQPIIRQSTRPRPISSPRLMHTKIRSRRLPTGAGLSAYFRYLSVWCMCLGWMFFNAVFYGLLTWMPNYLSAVHGSLYQTTRRFAIRGCPFGSGGELVGGRDPGPVARARARPTCTSGLVRLGRNRRGPSRSSASHMFATRSWSGRCSSADLFLPALVRMIPAIPASSLHGRGRASLGGCMNFAGNIAGITVPVIVGFFVQLTGSYSLVFDVLRLRGRRAFRGRPDFIHDSRKLPV